MKRRTFLTSTATGLAATVALPATSAAATPRAAFWAKYLTALHGSVPAAQVATFSGSTIAAAAEAKTALDAANTLSRAARWLTDAPLDSEGGPA